MATPPQGPQFTTFSSGTSAAQTHWNYQSIGLAVVNAENYNKSKNYQSAIDICTIALTENQKLPSDQRASKDTEGRLLQQKAFAELALNQTTNVIQTLGTQDFNLYSKSIAVECYYLLTRAYNDGHYPQAIGTAKNGLSKLASGAAIPDQEILKKEFQLQLIFAFNNAKDFHNTLLVPTSGMVSGSPEEFFVLIPQRLEDFWQSPQFASLHPNLKSRFRYEIALALNHLKQPELAIKVIDPGINTSVTDTNLSANLYRQKAAALVQNPEASGAALICLSTALYVQPQDPDIIARIYLDKARIYNTTKQPNEALTAVQTALEINKDCPPNQTLIGYNTLSELYIEGATAWILRMTLNPDANFETQTGWIVAANMHLNHANAPHNTPDQTLRINAQKTILQQHKTRLGVP